LTVASVEGETFTAEVVATVLGIDAHALIMRLSSGGDRYQRLVQAEQIQRLGTTRLSRYRFRHHLFQRYLYTALDQAARASIHENVGHALEQLHHAQPAEVTGVAGQLAWHFQEAGLAEKALAYRVLAGQQAVRLSANAEAVGHFANALVVLQTLPDTPERFRRELSLQIAHGVPQAALKGYAHPKVEAVYARAVTLCRQLGDTAHLFPALYGLWRSYGIRSELEAAREVADHLMQLAVDAQSQDLLVEAYRAVGITAFHRGEFSAARAAWEQGLAFYDVQAHRTHAFMYGHDPAVSCMGYLAHTL
jgi:predicted ATPase